MKEELLHFIWQYKLLKPVALKSVSGIPIKIIHPGELNTNAGPDFFNAKIKVGDLILAGNVEIHARSVDWKKHGHETDEAYSNIILHAVYDHDSEIEQNTKHNVEVLELKDFLEKDVLEKYDSLLSSKKPLPCSGKFTEIEPVKINSWLQRMLAERLETRSEHVKKLFEASDKDHRQTFYMMLARNFGFNINSVPFEMLSAQLPLSVLLKHRQTLFQLEALLLGTAGFLDETFNDKYPQQLQNEYEFLKNKYKLQPLKSHLWKYLRMMPANFPTVRLAQFAMIIHKYPELFSKPHEYTSLQKLLPAVSHPLQGYLSTHYKLDHPGVKKIGPLGKQSAENILTNTMANFLFFFGKQTGNDVYMEKALGIFDELSFENNQKTRLYSHSKLKFKTSGQSQGLIHLHDNYCVRKGCLRCSIAAELLKGK